MDSIASRSAARRAPEVVAAARDSAADAAALAGFMAAPVENQILFVADTVVPRPVQDFACRVIETRCNYQSFERWQRSFWAYDARARRVDGAPSIRSRSSRM
jgi:hypothetical protein